MGLACVPHLDRSAKVPAFGLDGVEEDLSWLTGPGAEEEDFEPGPLAAVADAMDANIKAQAVGFYPRKPTSLEQAGLNLDFVEKLLCRHLHAHGAACGRKLAHDTGLSFRIIEPILAALKTDMVIVHRKTAAAGDYEYMLTEEGIARALGYMRITAYADHAPVPLADYVASVEAQSLTLANVGAEELEAAFQDITMEPEMMARLGPAINAGRGMFLYGSPGNGKTTIAERVSRCFGTDIWIPRAIMVDDVCIRLYDPVLHEEVSDKSSGLMAEPFEDARWVRIRRPTVVVGGELTMDQLELRHDMNSNIDEAPLQMKSNCGVLLIDDFGRQTMPVAQLLNRWIVPLEKRYDYQKLPTGKKIQVPFDQLVVFSTNLAPKDLVDEAFLRRLPYKIEVADPTPAQFRRIFEAVAPKLGLKPTAEQIQKLIDEYYVAVGRPMRCCHPRDLMMQIRSYCGFHHLPFEFTDEAIAFGVNNYFAVM